MKWIGRIALILAFFSLVALAALPYLEPVREKWDRFREAWELVNRDPSATETVETETDATFNSSKMRYEDKKVTLNVFMVSMSGKVASGGVSFSLFGK